MGVRCARAWIVALAAAALLACGGSETEEDPRPICYGTHEVPDSGLVPNLSSEDWINLVVRGYREGQTSTQDCVGNPITWHETDDECDVHEPDDERDPEASELNEERVFVGRSDSVMRRPVWVVTHEFEDGDGFGPVAMTERTAQGVAVRAMGTLRMPIERARLRLRETGGQHILVADGERCPDEDEDGEETPPPAAGGGDEEGEEDSEPTCLRYARLMPVVGDRIMNPEIRTRDGERCLSPAQVYLSREETVGLENGWERTFRLAASMEFRAGAVILHEQVTIEDSDPRDPGRPARLFRTTDADRIIYVRRGGARTSNGISLFERALRAHGSTQLPIAESE